MDISDVGTGGVIGGVVAMILSALGIHSRLNRLDSRLDMMENKVVYNDVFQQYIKAADERYKRIENSLNAINEKLDRIGGKTYTRRKDDLKIEEGE